MIYWRNKIAPSTVNIAAGEMVTEIEVIEIRLNQSSLDKRVLQLIDKEIPYHILFLLVYQDRTQAWIGYKEQGNSGKYKPGSYYQTQRQSVDNLALKLEGLNMDAVYEGFVRHCWKEATGPAWQSKRGGGSGRAATEAAKGDCRTRDQSRREKQISIQVALNSELKRLRKELNAL